MTATKITDDPEALVLMLADGERRFEAWQRLDALGKQALAAIREGLRHGDWQVRRWCAMLLDHLADPESLSDLVPLLHDRKSGVRMWAVHSLACDRCKEDENPLDIFPLLAERIHHDDSIRVRRMAVIMLAQQPLDHRVGRLYAELLETESDRKLRFHAELGLERYRKAGLVPVTTEKRD